MMNLKDLDLEVERLLGKGGEKYIDMEILKMAEDMDPQDFKEFAMDFFKEHKGVKMEDILPQPLQFTKEQLKKPKVEQQEDLEETDLPDEINEEQSHYEVKKEKIEGKEKHYRITYNNGDMYVGQMENNQKSGWGVYNYVNGEVYDGMFIEDDIHGYGKYQFVSGAEYDGEWYEGNKQGFGTLKFPNGDIYEGEFKKDDMHGKGKYKYSNGDVFEGLWKEGKKNGRGQFQGKDGRLIIGEWKEDVFGI